MHASNAGRYVKPYTRLYLTIISYDIWVTNCIVAEPLTFMRWLVGAKGRWICQTSSGYLIQTTFILLWARVSDEIWLVTKECFLRVRAAVIGLVSLLYEWVNTLLQGDSLFMASGIFLLFRQTQNSVRTAIGAWKCVRYFVHLYFTYSIKNFPFVPISEGRILALVYKTNFFY